jgi:peptidoglycan LD-endopeptidase LytH
MHPSTPSRPVPSVPPVPRRLVLPGLVALLLAGCGLSESLLEPLRGATPHERYGESLERAGLAESTLARQWVRMSEAAFRYPVEPSLPFREAGRFSPAEPTSLAYRFELRRGERLEVVLDRDPEGGPGRVPGGDPSSEGVTGGVEAARVFIDLFRLRDPDGGGSSQGRPLLVAWTDPPADTLVYEARASAIYLLRVQPELLAGGAFELDVRTGPSLAFPVAGHDSGHIRSGFGAPRDGGRRAHHGVDIFAPRGTPVLAAEAGIVTRVRETPVGGRVVWVRDEGRALSRYYAHLDSQLVEAGATVAAGDTLGTVGNTGNARTTPPHLHFGIYVRGEGAVDPWPFLHRPSAIPRALQVDRKWFLEQARLRNGAPPIRIGPDGSALEVEADPGTLRILAGSGSWYRVRLADGREGYAAEEALDAVPTASPPLVGVAARLSAEGPSP